MKNPLIRLGQALGVVILFLSFMAHSQEKLPEPSVLVARAEKGQTELLRVVLKLKSNVKQLTDQVLFDKYFDILPTLSKLSKRSGLEVIYPDGVKGLGLAMVSHGNRWLSISKDSKFSGIIGLRYRDNSLLVEAKETETNYDPTFADIQTYLTYKFSNKFHLSFFVNPS